MPRICGTPQEVVVQFAALKKVITGFPFGYRLVAVVK
jgi:hypothetical protein